MSIIWYIFDGFFPIKTFILKAIQTDKHAFSRKWCDTVCAIEKKKNKQNHFNLQC